MELWRAAGLQDKKYTQDQENNSYRIETRHKPETWTEEENGSVGSKTRKYASRRMFRESEKIPVTNYLPPKRTIVGQIKTSVQFSCSVMSNSLWPHGLQHTRPLCPSPTPASYSNSCPLSQWCHPTISSSVVPFSSTFNLSQHQGLFQWVGSSDQVAKLLEFQLQY